MVLNTYVITFIYHLRLYQQPLREKIQQKMLGSNPQWDPEVKLHGQLKIVQFTDVDQVDLETKKLMLAQALVN
jgi:hypothetical protein